MMLFGPLVVWLLVTIFGPYDVTQGVSSKLLYIHVPTVWIAYLAYTLTFLYSALYLFSNKSKYDSIAIANAKSGVVFTIVTLLSGSYWGKQTWGTWWVWDARIVSTLILFIMYLGLISLHDSFNNFEKADKFLSILVIVGSVNIPIIKMSVEWWSTLHQPASITLSEKPAIDLVMLYPLFGSIIGFAGIVTCLVILSSKFQIFRREKNKSWVNDYV